MSDKIGSHASSGSSKMFGKTELDLNHLLAIENTTELLEHVCPATGHLLWPLIRIPFLRFVLSDLCYGAPLNDLGPRVVLGRALLNLTRAAAHNVANWHSAKASVLLMGTGLGNYKKENQWRNRLSDDFASAIPDTYVMEDLWNWQWPFPRHNCKVLFHTPLQVASTAFGKFAVRGVHRRQAKALVAFVRRRSQQILEWELGSDREAFLVNMLAKHMAAIPFKQAVYQKMLGDLKVELLIKEEACYGPSGVLIATARKMGIVTAEYQHGIVSAGTDAYNFAPVLLDSDEYRKTLPEYFLTYGKWWGAQINAPVKKVAIGNPHRTAQIQHIDRTRPRSDILILGDGIDTPLYLAFCDRLMQRLGNEFRVVFRPHPFERPIIDSLARSRGSAVHIDRNGDIYSSFMTAHAVLSEVSTGLFEAVGLVENIFLWDTPKSRFCYPSHPFELIRDANDMELKLARGHNKTVVADDLWENGWEENYRNFVRQALAL